MSRKPRLPNPSAEADSVILAVRKRMERDSIRFHTISLVVEVMLEMGYRLKQKAPNRMCFRCKQKPAELSNGECRECHNAAQRQARRR